MLLGKYRINSVLGAGGMGIVLAATHLRMGGPVALKMLLPELALNPTFVERFAREAHSASRIRSEHVARVLDVETLDDGLPLIVMELLEGHDLADEVKLNGPLSVDRAAEFVLQACEALAEAHSLGIIHRDLKPANLFLTRRADGSELIKVMDFGIAKALSDAGSPSLTETQDVVGSPLYMSPEQLRSSKDVDARTDIWSLGVILYELVTGDVPFAGSSSAAVLAAVAADRPRPIAELLPEAPLPLVRLLDKALEKSPENRHANVADFAQELSPLAPDSARISTERVSRIIYGAAGTPQRGVQRDASATTMIAAGSSSRATPPASVKELNPPRTASPIGRERLRFATLAALGVIAVAGGVALLRSQDSEVTGEQKSKEQAQLTTPPALAPAPLPASATRPAQDIVSERAEPVDARSTDIGSTNQGAQVTSKAASQGVRSTKTSLPLIQTTQPQMKGSAPPPGDASTQPSLVDQATETRK